MSRSDREAVLDEELALVRDDMLFPDRMLQINWPETLSSTKMHNTYNVRLEEFVWARKMSYVLNFLRLEKLTVDLRYSQCLDGCCSLVSQGIESMRKGFALALPNTIRVKGAKVRTQSAKGKMSRWTFRAP